MPAESSVASLDRPAVRLATGWLLLLGAGYAALTTSPLRLNVDAVAYVLQSLGGPLDGAAPTRPYPPGYPAILAAMRAAGFAMPFAIVALNVAAVLAGAAAAVALFREAFGMGREAARLAGAGVLSSAVLVQHAVLPLPDVLVAAGGWAVLALLVGAERGGEGTRPAAFRLVAAAALTAGLTWVRTPGAVLVVPLAVAVWDALSGWRWRLLVVAGVVTAGGLVGAALAWESVLAYADVLARNYREYGTASVWWNVQAKLLGLVEVVLNVPLSFVGGSDGPLRVPALLGGALVVGGLAWGGWRGRGQARAVEAFALAWLVVLLVWPGRSARFWLPVLPLLLGYGWTALRASVHARRYAAAALGWLGLTGAAALGYALWLSTPPTAFPERYAGGQFRPAFEVFCSGGPWTAGTDEGSGNRKRHRVWLVLSADQRALHPSLSPCPDGPPAQRPGPAAAPMP